MVAEEVGIKIKRGTQRRPFARKGKQEKPWKEEKGEAKTDG